MKIALTYSENLIIARNQNEIRNLEEYRKELIRNVNEAISDLRKQNREILGRE